MAAGEIIIPLIPLFLWLIGLYCIPEEEHQELLDAIERAHKARKREMKDER